MVPSRISYFACVCESVSVSAVPCILRYYSHINDEIGSKYNVRYDGNPQYNHKHTFIPFAIMIYCTEILSLFYSMNIEYIGTVRFPICWYRIGIEDMQLIFYGLYSFCHPFLMRQSTLQYVRSNESSVFEFVHTSTEHTEIFMPLESSPVPAVSISNGGNSERHQSMNGSSVLLKRRASER